MADVRKDRERGGSGKGYEGIAAFSDNLFLLRVLLCLQRMKGVHLNLKLVLVTAITFSSSFSPGFFFFFFAFSFKCFSLALENNNINKWSLSAKIQTYVHDPVQSWKHVKALLAFCLPHCYVRITYSLMASLSTSS